LFNAGCREERASATGGKGRFFWAEKKKKLAGLASLVKVNAAQKEGDSRPSLGRK